MCEARSGASTTGASGPTSIATAEAPLRNACCAFRSAMSTQTTMPQRPSHAGELTQSIVERNAAVPP
jgi:hypothetical protein